MTRFPGDARLIIYVPLVVLAIYLPATAIYRLLQWLGLLPA